MVLVAVEIPQLHCDKVVVVPVLLVLRVPQLQVVIKTVFIPQLQIVVKFDAIHESFAFACFVMPVVVPRSRGDSTGTVLGQGRCALCCATTVAWFDGAKTVEVPQLQFTEGRRLPCRDAKVILMVQCVQKTIQTPQLLVDKVVDVPGVRVVQVPRVPSWRIQSRSHSCRSS